MAGPCDAFGKESLVSLGSRFLRVMAECSGRIWHKMRDGWPITTGKAVVRIKTAAGEP